MEPQFSKSFCFKGPVKSQIYVILFTLKDIAVWDEMKQVLHYPGQKVERLILQSWFRWLILSGALHRLCYRLISIIRLACELKSVAI
jgi:hypothetical protein